MAVHVVNTCAACIHVSVTMPGRIPAGCAESIPTRANNTALGPLTLHTQSGRQRCCSAEQEQRLSRQIAAAASSRYMLQLSETSQARTMTSTGRKQYDATTSRSRTRSSSLSSSARSSRSCSSASSYLSGSVQPKRRGTTHGGTRSRAHRSRSSRTRPMICAALCWNIWSSVARGGAGRIATRAAAALSKSIATAPAVTAGSPPSPGGPAGEPGADPTLQGRGTEMGCVAEESGPGASAVASAVLQEMSRVWRLVVRPSMRESGRRTSALSRTTGLQARQHGYHAASDHTGHLLALLQHDDQYSDISIEQPSTT